MISNLKPHKLIFRDGTSQQDRYLDALDPDYVHVEERSLEELISYAQLLAKELNFFNKDNKISANWEALLIDDIDSYRKKTETGKEIQRKQWAKKIVAHAHDPQLFNNNAEDAAKLSRPQLTLFVSFLQLLNHVKSQINTLTKKHLDFYFLEALGLTQKSTTPDSVNVLFELAADVVQLEVKKGTVLTAGKDEEGNELLYETNESSVVSSAKIESLNTIFVEKKTITIRGAREDNVDDEDNGFTKMMELAVGSPDPGDPLPPLPGNAKSLIDVHNNAKNNDAETKSYVKDQLFLLPEDFEFIIKIYQNDLDPQKRVESDDWDSIYVLLEKAYKDKLKYKRKNTLKDIREKELDKDRGMDNMLKYALGDPKPDDNLAIYRGEKTKIKKVYNDLKLRGSTDEARAIKNEASNYIRDELFLAENDFIRLVRTNDNKKAAEADWSLLYVALELAQRKKRSEVLPAPVKEELLNVYGERDAKTSAFSVFGEEEGSLRFKTFGHGDEGIAPTTNPATIGFGISSPLLILNEGKRIIEATVAFETDSVEKPEDLQKFIAKQKDGSVPFLFYLTTEKEWIQPTVTNMQYGNCITGYSSSQYTATLSKDIIRKTEGADFTNQDLERYIIWKNGTIFRIISFVNASAVKVEKVGSVAAQNSIIKYDTDAVSLSGMQFTLELKETDLPIVAIDPSLPGNRVNSNFPTLAIVLNNKQVQENGKTHYPNLYQHVMNLKLEKVHLQVSVEGMIENTLQNDLKTINPKKQFEPFGYDAELETNFYFANLEISHKKISTLNISLNWMKAPSDFKEYYKNYWLVKANNEKLAAAKYKIKSNNDFKANLTFFDRRADVFIKQIELFGGAGKTVAENIPEAIKTSTPAYEYKRDNDFLIKNNVLDWNRYFCLELTGLDFQHESYSNIRSKQSSSTNEAISALEINEPYTPKLKSISFGYTAETDINLSKPAIDNGDSLFHIQPFGYNKLKNTAEQSSNYFLPYFNNEGELLIGIDKLVKPQILPILFQMAEGSANPDVEKSVISWSYLRNNEWLPFESKAILSDTTNGLINTGIIKFEIPVAATCEDTLLDDSLYWIKATCEKNTSGISDSINILTQAINATLSSSEVADAHFKHVLPIESITSTLSPIPGIKTIYQPYTSSKGKPAESDALFYNRISERLRHKNRALTMWDYEHMILEQFPEVYKVKCLPASIDGKADNLGKVDIIVIPDIKGKLPFNPFEPKVPADTIFQIQKYIESRMPVYVNLNVKNPTYIQIKTRFALKLKEGYNEGFYAAQLEEDIKRFLAPWAFEEGGDITIGGKVYASVLVNFIAEHKYVDYVAKIKLFQSEDGIHFTDARTLNNGENVIKADKPDVILVSAPEHEIDIIDISGYEEDDFEGLDYMQIELDFKIGEDLLD